MGRSLILLCAVFAMASAMGYFGGDNYYGHQEPIGDWPDQFPEKPDGFAFKCNGKCYCPCQCGSQTTTETPEGENQATTTAADAPTTSYAATHSSPPTTSTTKTSTTVTTTTTQPTTVTSTTRPTTTTTKATTQSSSTAPTSTVRSSTSPTTTVAPSPDEPAVDSVRVVFTGGPVAMDEPDDETLPTKSPQTGTTFWIRTPTPPNAPNPVNPGGQFSLGHPTFAAPKIDSPFAPDQAIAPLDANIDGDMEFNIRTVGTPKAPRAPIDPDA